MNALRENKELRGFRLSSLQTRDMSQVKMFCCFSTLSCNVYPVLH